MTTCQEMKVAKKFSGRTFNIIYPMFGFNKYAYYICECIYMVHMNLKLMRFIVSACLLLSFLGVYGFCTPLEQVVFGEARSLCSQDRAHMQLLSLGTCISPEAVRTGNMYPPL